MDFTLSFLGPFLCLWPKTENCLTLSVLSTTEWEGKVLGLRRWKPWMTSNKVNFRIIETHNFYSEWAKVNSTVMDSQHRTKSPCIFWKQGQLRWERSQELHSSPPESLSWAHTNTQISHSPVMVQPLVVQRRRYAADGLGWWICHRRRELMPGIAWPPVHTTKPAAEVYDVGAVQVNKTQLHEKQP